jgi:CubicO group peptidase (beta-lactamase class C family)
MVNSDAYELDTDVPNLAVGYTQDREGKRGGTLRNNIFMHVIKGGPAGGGYSTVEDLHRFANALREGTLISSETLQQWTTPGDKNRSYAFGFEVYQSSNPKVIGHRGGFPGISSGLAVDLDTGYTVAVMANMDSRAVGTLMERIKELLSRVKT